MNYSAESMSQTLELVFPKTNEIPKIFSRFYRSSAVSQEEGVGIGLYLSREIITLQGGYIKVSSEPGKGSCFSVFLPRSFQKKEETSAF
ncbi:ATP-binding protein [Eubacterium callanderi]|uniref:sensor histidine kinase n=2 Tax=Eubacterium callanderi TaxID=53442 RepID=UPI0029F59DAD|nr:ATP-binding protein [Eubacterium callanderi]